MRYELDEFVQLVPTKISALPPRFVLAAYRAMPRLGGDLNDLLSSRSGWSGRKEMDQ